MRRCPLADTTIDRVVGRPLPARALIFDSLVAPMLLGLVGQLGALGRCVEAAPNRSDLEATWLGASDLWTMRADGSNQTNLTNNGLANSSPTFSPDGTRIAFSRTLIGGNAQVFAMPATGGAPVSPSGPDGRSAAPTWGPGSVPAPLPVTLPAPVSFKTTPDAVILASDRALKLRFAALPGATGTLTVSARVPAKTVAAASAARTRKTRRVTLIPKRAFRADASGKVSVRVRVSARRLARRPAPGGASQRSWTSPSADERSRIRSRSGAPPARAEATATALVWRVRQASIP